MGQGLGDEVLRLTRENGSANMMVLHPRRSAIDLGPAMKTHVQAAFPNRHRIS